MSGNNYYECDPNKCDIYKSFNIDQFIYDDNITLSINKYQQRHIQKYHVNHIKTYLVENEIDCEDIDCFYNNCNNIHYQLFHSNENEESTTPKSCNLSLDQLDESEQLDDNEDLSSGDDDDDDYDDYSSYDSDDNVPLYNDHGKNHLFISGFLPKKIPEDIIVLIERKWLDPEFKWNMGLLDWRQYSRATQKEVEWRYGRRSKDIIDSINYSISKCIRNKRFDLAAVCDDIINRSTSNSWIVDFVAQELSQANKGCELYRDKINIHEMLYQIITSISVRKEIGLQPTHSNLRNIALMSLQCLPSPKLAVAMQQSFEIAVESPISLADVREDIYIGFPKLDNSETQSSFIFDTLITEYPEYHTSKSDKNNNNNNNNGYHNYHNNNNINKCHINFLDNKNEEDLILYQNEQPNDLKRLYDLIKAFFRKPGSKNTHIELVEVNIIDEKLANDCFNYLQTESPNFIFKNHNRYSPSSLPLKSRPYIVSKAIDLLNGKSLTMNIVNLFTEIRMATHYTEMLKQKQKKYIANHSSARNNYQYPMEPFGIHEKELTVTEFLNNYPLFEVLREKKQYDHVIHCLSSTVTNIVKNVIPPLPLHPNYIINDSYYDFYDYVAQISRFISNRLHFQYKLNLPLINHKDDTLLHALKFPLQIDFWIIPQCVSESKIQHQHQIITDYQKQCDQLLFGIGDNLIEDIGQHLENFNIDYKKFELDREPTQFYKVLSRGFDEFQNNQRHQRYVIVIDRRCPKYDGTYTLNKNGSRWKDRLYIYSPPQFNKISPRCDLFPEGFINRTIEYLMPLKQNKNGQHDVIGANCIANGYIFALSYHLYQIDKVKVFFHSNGCGQRLTIDEIKYYLPRLFMKIDGKFQDQHKRNNEASFNFIDISFYDKEHKNFHRTTMK